MASASQSRGLQAGGVSLGGGMNMGGMMGGAGGLELPGMMQ